MVFTFGKYAGFPLCEIPASYLGLAVETFTMPEALTHQCRMELMRRFSLTQSSTGVDSPEDLPTLIRKTYRELAVKYHPDRGGATEAMQAVNDFYQALTRK